MPRGKSTVEYVVISDLTKPVDEQEGYVLVVEGRGGYTDKNRQKALELALCKYEEEEFPVDEFPDGITLEHVLPAAPEPPILDEQELLPIQIGAREAADLARLQADVQDAIEEIMPYKETLEKLKNYGNEFQPMLSNEEKEQVRDKNFPKALNQMASAIISQDDYQKSCTGNYKLIIKIIEDYSRGKELFFQEQKLIQTVEARESLENNYSANGE